MLPSPAIKISVQFTSNRWKVGQMEAAKAWSRCRDAQQSAIEERTKCPLRDTKHARVPSSLSYSLILSTIKARAFGRGISVTEVHPAYSPVIGHTKFLRRYGLVNSRAPQQGSSRGGPYNSRRDQTRTRRPWHLPRTGMESRRHGWSFWARTLCEKRRLQRPVGRSKSDSNCP
jgi:hypothetical protein